jgi:hypothetical protein
MPGKASCSGVDVTVDRTSTALAELASFLNLMEEKIPKTIQKMTLSIT